MSDRKPRDRTPFMDSLVRAVHASDAFSLETASAAIAQALRRKPAAIIVGEASPAAAKALRDAGNASNPRKTTTRHFPKP